mgnify:CR=1 FL=1
MTFHGTGLIATATAEATTAPQLVAVADKALVQHGHTDEPGDPPLEKADVLSDLEAHAHGLAARVGHSHALRARCRRRSRGLAQLCSLHSLFLCANRLARTQLEREQLDARPDALQAGPEPEGPANVAAAA